MSDADAAEHSAARCDVNFVLIGKPYQLVEQLVPTLRMGAEVQGCGVAVLVTGVIDQDGFFARTLYDLG